MIRLEAKLHNRFDFDIYDTETGETTHAQAENIVLDNMWTRLCTRKAYFEYIGVGTGSGTLSPARNTLFAHLASKAVTTVEKVFDTDFTGHITKKITFSEIEAIGVWTEVGILYGNSSTNYVTHALITDSEGNPITINKTNTKIVTVYATVFATASTLPGYIPYRGSKNLLLQYLLTDLNSMTASIALFNQDAFEDSLGFTAARGGVGWTADTANKRMYTDLVRFGTTAGNKNIYAVGLVDFYGVAYAFMINVQDIALYPGHQFVNVAVGTGDGVTTEFDLPKSFPKPLSETIYLDGVATTRGTDYEMRHGIKAGEVWFSSSRPAWSVQDTIIKLHQPENLAVDGVVAATCVHLNGGTYSSDRLTQTSFWASEDGATWDEVVIDGNTDAGFATRREFPMLPKKYRFVRWKSINNSSGSNSGTPTVEVLAAAPSQKHIKFATPPAVGVAITATFSVDYIPKSENFVLDLQAEIVFGEGV